MLSYRKANQLLYELQNKIEGKNKDIYIMSKDLNIQDIPSIEFLKTDYTNKYLCIKQALVNDTFEAINDSTEAYMKENHVKLLPLKNVSSLGITDRLIQSKKYKSILLEDDSINNKLTDTKYPKQYLPDIMLLAISTNDIDCMNATAKFANFSNLLKENYAILSDIHQEEEGMKYFTLQRRRKGIRYDYEELIKEYDNKEYEDFELDKSIQPGINVLKKERLKTRRSEK